MNKQAVSNVRAKIHLSWHFFIRGKISLLISLYTLLEILNELFLAFRKSSNPSFHLSKNVSCPMTLIEKLISFACNFGNSFLYIITGRIKIPYDTSNVNLIKMTSTYAHLYVLDQRLFLAEWNRIRLVLMEGICF